MVELSIPSMGPVINTGRRGTMFWNFLLPNKLVTKYASDYNGAIEVRTEFGRPRVVVKGIPQSGGIVQDILKKGVDEFVKPKNFLLLGLGGGAILHEVRKRWPECKITAVDIDPVMIEVARKYFRVDEIENLEIVNDDAVGFVFNTSNDQMNKRSKKFYENTKLQNNEITKFDAILVDCYVGDQVPDKLESLEFLRNLQMLLSEGGKIVFNRIVSPKEAYLSTQNFIGKLGLVYDNVMTKKAYSNMLITVF